MKNYGSFHAQGLDAQTYANISIEPGHMNCHWQIMASGHEVIALSFDRLSIQLSPMDAAKLAEMLVDTVEDFHVEMAGREAAEYELSVGLRQAYAMLEDDPA